MVALCAATSACQSRTPLSELATNVNVTGGVALGAGRELHTPKNAEDLATTLWMVQGPWSKTRGKPRVCTRNWVAFGRSVV